MSKQKKENKKSIFEDLLGDFLPKSKDPVPEKKDNDGKPPVPNPQPSLQTIGLADCSVCKTEVSVVLTRTGHPFTACGKCGARTFFNSRVAIDILKRQMRGI